jgi:predicted ATPase
MPRRRRCPAAFVPLAAVTDTALVGPAIATALGLGESNDMAAHLADCRLLLVLDNCEQVIGAAPLVSELLGACPGLTALATSRESLRVGGEYELAVPPLTEDAAARLFLDRARAVQPRFALSPQDADAVAELCRRLDGLPLAIELAAARVKVFPPAALLERLCSARGALALLRGGARDALPHHRALWDAIDWSYGLLEEREQRLFRRLGVFVADFSLDAADAVAAERRWDVIASLIDKSLLQGLPTPHAGRRFSILETIRAYALARLAASGEQEEALDAHAAYYLGLAEGGTRPEGLEAEHANLRAAVSHLIARGRTAQALRLAAGLVPFWRASERYREGTAVLSEVAGMAGIDAPDLRQERGRTLVGAGWLDLAQGDHGAAGRRFDEALAAGDAGSAADAHLGLGQLRQTQGDFEAAETLFDAGLAAYRALDDRTGAAHALFMLGMLASRRGELAAARRHLEESLALARATGDRPGLARTLGALAVLAFRGGDYDAARALYEECLAVDHALGDRRCAAWRQLGLGRVLHAQGDRAGARRLSEQAAAALRELGERARGGPPV